jgi:hypothetical protein
VDTGFRRYDKERVPMVEPPNKDWAWLDALVGPLDDDFVEAVNEPPVQQARPALDELFQRERLGEARDRH